MSLRLWDRLPEELLDLIIQRLNILNRARSTAVCKSWRSAIKQASHHDDRVWFLCCFGLTNSEHIRFFGLCDAIYFNVKIPESVRGTWYTCDLSDDGRWIVLKSATFSDLSLFDPITGESKRMIVGGFFPQRIGFCKLGDENWTFEEFDDSFDFSNICLYNGTCYVLVYRGRAPVETRSMNLGGIEITLKFIPLVNSGTL